MEKSRSLLWAFFLFPLLPVTWNWICWNYNLRVHNFLERSKPYKKLSSTKKPAKLRRNAFLLLPWNIFVFFIVHYSLSECNVIRYQKFSFAAGRFTRLHWIYSFFMCPLFIRNFISNNILEKPLKTSTKKKEKAKYDIITMSILRNEISISDSPPFSILCICRAVART